MNFRARSWILLALAAPLAAQTPTAPDPQPDPPSGNVDVDDRPIVDPRLDPIFGNLKSQRIPSAFLEVEIGAGFVVGRVPAVDAR